MVRKSPEPALGNSVVILGNQNEGKGKDLDREKDSTRISLALVLG